MGFYYVYDENKKLLRRFIRLNDAIDYAKESGVPCYVYNSYLEQTEWSSL